jgi:hypothetical protein
MMTALLIPIAHAGHWIESVLVLIPTVGFIGWLAFITVRDRRRIARGEIDPDEGYDEEGWKQD